MKATSHITALGACDESVQRVHAVRGSVLPTWYKYSVLEGPAHFETVQLRRTLRHACPTDIELDDFCRNFFPEVHRQFAPGQDLKSKEDLLLELTKPLRAELSFALLAFARQRGLPATSYLNDPEPQEQVQDDLLARVRAACFIRERHRETLTLQVHSEARAALRVIEVAYTNRRFSVRYGLGLTEQPIDLAVLTRFQHELAAHFLVSSAAAPAQLVYAGPAADAATLAAAERQLIEVMSIDDYEALLSLGPAVQRQTARLAQDPRYPSSLYVPQRMLLCRDASFRFQESPEPALDEVLSWLRSPHGRFVLLLGDFGAGKTFLLHELVRRLGQSGGPLVPLLCELRQIEKTQDLSMLLVQHMRQAGIEPIDPEALLHMLELGRVVLCFDGFDELALRTSFERAAEHLETLLQAVRGHAKVVVTSRTQHFVNDQQIKTTLGQRLDRVPCYVGRLLPFERPQILQFLRNRLNDEERAQQRYRILDEIKDLLGLSHNPRMLSFISQIDESKLFEAQRQHGTISAAGLYQILVDDWLDFEIRRRSERVADRSLSKTQLLDSATRLALLLWQKTERTAGLAEIASASRGALEDIEIAVHQVGSASLLVRDPEGRFSFLHQSVLEWLVARAAAAEIQKGASADVLSSGDMSELMAEFFIGILGRNEAVSWAKQTLKATETDSATACRKDNALLIFRRMKQSKSLSAEGVRLTGQDLRGQDLSGQNLRWADLSSADLRGALLVGTRLQDADLQQAKLGGADLRRADLRRADLRQADLRRANLMCADLRGAKLEGANFDLTKQLGLRLDDADRERLGSAASTSIAALKPQTMPRLGLAPSAYAGQCLAWSPSGALLAIGMDTGTIALLDNPQSLTVLRTLHCNSGEVHAAAFSPQGNLLAGAYQDGTVKLWDVETGDKRRTLFGHADAVFGLAFSPDGTLLISGSLDRTLRIFRVADGMELAVLRGHEGAVFSVAVRAQGDIIASGSGDRTIRFWNLADWTERAVLTGHTQAVWSVAFSADGNRLASGSWDHTVRLWQVESQALAQTLSDYSDSVYSTSFSPDGNQIVVGLANGGVQLTSLEEGVPSVSHGGSPHTPLQQKRAVLAVAFSPDGACIASASLDQTVRLFRPELGGLHLQQMLSNSTMPVYELAFSPDGETLVCAALNRVHTWRLRTGVLAGSMSGLAGAIWSIAVSSDGKSRAAGCGDHSICLWHRDSEAPKVMRRHQAMVTSLAFSPDGSLLASASADGTLRLWQVEDGRLLHTILDFNVQINHVRWSPEGNRLVAALEDNSIRLLRVVNDSMQSEETLTCPLRGTCNAASFSPDGKLLASGGGDHRVRLWRIGSQTPWQELTGHLAGIWDVAFSPDGQLLASASRDQTVILWRVADGRIMAVLRDHQDVIYSVAFHPDGTTLASASLDGTVRLWNVSEQRCVAVLSASERGWVSFVPDGRYKSDGETGGLFWHVLGTCRLEVGELEEFVPGIRLPDDTPLLELPPWAPQVVLPLPSPSHGVALTAPQPIAETESITVPISPPLPRNPEETLPLPAPPIARRAVRWPWAIAATVMLVIALVGYRMRSDSEPAPKISRGFKPVELAAPTANRTSSRSGHAVLFATTRYDDPRWPQLKTPASDADEIAADLRNLYGFDARIVSDPNVEAIRTTIRALAEKKYGDDDQLFIMFSGHGDKDETLKKGWIIARDSTVDERRRAYPYSELREDIDNIPCRHILLILDVCFGGSFDPSIRDAQTRGKEYIEASTAEFIQRKLRYRSRLYVSSVDQKTQAPEGRGHSPFAWKLLEALRSGGGPDGVLTWNELIGYLEKLNPEPRGGIFPRSINSDPGGDFLFIVNAQAPKKPASAL